MASTMADDPSPPPESTVALEIAGLSHAFGPKQALCEVGLTISPGRFCVLLGLNGAGKTTLFSLITRLYDNTSGAIKVFGFDVRRQPGEALRRLGVVFQQRTLDLDLSVWQNLAYHGALHGLARGEVKRRAQAALARVGLTDRFDDKIRRLSGGQVRRVEIARCLLHEPRLLLLDEATAGLDIESRQDLLDHLQVLCREEGLAVLWATHLIDEVLPDSQVVVLHAGRVLADGSRDAVMAQGGGSNVREAFTRLIANADAKTAKGAAA